MKSMKLKMFTKKCRKENIRNEFYHGPMRIGSKMVSLKIGNRIKVKIRWMFEKNLYKCRKIKFKIKIFRWYWLR